jgi:hypothetical protein
MSLVLPRMLIINAVGFFLRDGLPLLLNTGSKEARGND